MRITINPVLDLETLAWVADDGSYEYDGPVAAFKVSKQAKQNRDAQLRFYNVTTAQQKERFAEQTDVLGKITAASAPIVARGVNQYGFSDEEDAILRGEIISRMSEAEAHTVEATRLRELQRTGGTEVLPAGAMAELEQHATILGEQAKAKALAEEKLKGFEVGRLNYAQALESLGKVASLESPTAFTAASAEVGGKSTAAISQADAERSNILGKILGGAAGGVAGFMVGGPAGAVLGTAKGAGGDFTPTPTP